MGTRGRRTDDRPDRPPWATAVAVTLTILGVLIPQVDVLHRAGLRAWTSRYGFVTILLLRVGIAAAAAWAYETWWPGKLSRPVRSRRKRAPRASRRTSAGRRAAGVLLGFPRRPRLGPRPRPPAAPFPEPWRVALRKRSRHSRRLPPPLRREFERQVQQLIAEKPVTVSRSP